MARPCGAGSSLSRPRLDQSTVDREMLVGEQIQLARFAHHRVEEAPCHLTLEQAFAQAREVRLIESALLQTHVQEPAEQNVVIEHLAEQPIRTHRVQRDQQTRLEQPFWRNRRPARARVQLIEVAAQRLERRIGIALDRTQRVRSRNTRLRREVTEHRRLRIQITTHRASLVRSYRPIHKLVDTRQMSSFASRC